MNLREMSELLGHRFIDENQAISNLAYDSRQVEPGGVFFAIKGQDQDGHMYIDKAIEKGAIAIVGEEDLTLDVPYFQVFNTKKALAVVSNEFYQKPSKDISLVGVIGTNGKTTITYLIQHVFECLGVDSGLIGTNGSWVGQKIKASRTTPMSLDLNDLLKEGVKNNLPYLVMEVSSHGIKENRVDQIQFDRLVFTNITPEHLDYHKTFEDYLFTKMRPFIQFSDYDEDKVAIINCDDEHADYFIGATNGHLLTYGCQAKADLFAKDIVYTLERTEFSLYIKGEFMTRMAIPLFGKYNVYNVLSVLAYFYSLGYNPLKIIPFIENVSSIEGRFEYLKTKDGVTVVIDYAHNPDAIFQVLTCLNVIAKGQIITVLGAGHKTFEDYLFTKMRPFIQFSDYDEDKVAIINCDDEHADYFIGATNGHLLTYGCQAKADLFAKDIVYTLERTEFSLYIKGEFMTRMAIPLFGKYNVYNVLSVLAYFYSLGYNPLKIIPFIENVSSIEGRFEYLKTKDGVTVVIDYAHNPDAIFQVLTCLNVIAKGQIITVLGAGGNRDKAKRKIMGKHATRLSDHVVFTSDNPRNEDPLSIIYDLLSGTSSVNYTVIVDREKAIEAAIKKAKPDDLVVVLGKGHEKTQNINGKIVPFNDKIVVEEVIRKRGK